MVVICNTSDSEAFGILLLPARSHGVLDLTLGISRAWLHYISLSIAATNSAAEAIPYM